MDLPYFTIVCYILPSICNLCTIYSCHIFAIEGLVFAFFIKHSIKLRVFPIGQQEFGEAQPRLVKAQTPLPYIYHLRLPYICYLLAFYLLFICFLVWFLCWVLGCCFGMGLFLFLFSFLGSFRVCFGLHCGLHCGLLSGLHCGLISGLFCGLWLAFGVWCLAFRFFLGFFFVCSSVCFSVCFGVSYCEFWGVFYFRFVVWRSGFGVWCYGILAFLAFLAFGVLVFSVFLEFLEFWRLAFGIFLYTYHISAICLPYICHLLLYTCYLSLPYICYLLALLFHQMLD
jgi:hypothetical protein